jgi:hypothetical protein
MGVALGPSQPGVSGLRGEGALSPLGARPPDHTWASPGLVPL